MRLRKLGTRILVLLLVILMLPTEAFAASQTGGESVAVAGDDGNSKYSTTGVTGHIISVQFTNYLTYDPLDDYNGDGKIENRLSDTSLKQLTAWLCSTTPASDSSKNPDGGVLPGVMFATGASSRTIVLDTATQSKTVYTRYPISSILTFYTGQTQPSIPSKNETGQNLLKLIASKSTGTNPVTKLTAAELKACVAGNSSTVVKSIFGMRGKPKTSGSAIIKAFNNYMKLKPNTADIPDWFAFMESINGDDSIQFIMYMGLVLDVLTEYRDSSAKESMFTLAASQLSAWLQGESFKLPVIQSDTASETIFETQKYTAFVPATTEARIQGHPLSDLSISGGSIKQSSSNGPFHTLGQGYSKSGSTYAHSDFTYDDGTEYQPAAIMFHSFSITNINADTAEGERWRGLVAGEYTSRLGLPGIGTFSAFPLSSFSPPPQMRIDGSWKFEADCLVGIDIEKDQVIPGPTTYPTNFTEDYKVTVRVELDKAVYSYRSWKQDWLPETGNYGPVQYDIDESGTGMAAALLTLAQLKTPAEQRANPITLNLNVFGYQDVDVMSESAATGLTEGTLYYYKNGLDLCPDCGPNMDTAAYSWLSAGGSWIKTNGQTLTSHVHGGEMPLLDILYPDCTAQMAQIPGARAERTGNAIKLIFEDWAALANAITSRENNGGSMGGVSFHGGFSFSGNISLTSEHKTDTESKDHWVLIGGQLSTFYLDEKTGAVMSTGYAHQAKCAPKWDFVRVTPTPEDPDEPQPWYFSEIEPLYTEFKTGTLTNSGANEPFDAMLGTPTTTDTSVRTDFVGEYSHYKSQGNFEQFWAIGGSEFCVQMEGEYQDAINWSRSYTYSFGAVLCDVNYTGTCNTHHGNCMTDSEGKGYCPSPCPSPLHYTCNPHYVGDTFSWSQAVQNMWFVKFNTCRVWQLNAGRLSGTRALLDISHSDASIAGAPTGASWNEACSPSASQGRIVYDYDAPACDAVSWGASSDNSCTQHTANNLETAHGTTAGLVTGAYCVSDFLVLSTSKGTQSIMYHEYYSESSSYEIDVTKSGPYAPAETIEFRDVEHSELWYGNGQTAYQWDVEGVTYGGYNGKWSSPSSKYRSTAKAPTGNLSWSGTQAYKNRSGVYGNCYRGSTDSVFKLKNEETLKIPDYKVNGFYRLGEVDAFYECLCDLSRHGVRNRVYYTPTLATGQTLAGASGRGKVIRSVPYSRPELNAASEYKSHKINDVAVYDPVSNQYAVIESLPESRDQRWDKNVNGGLDGNYTPICPGASCQFKTLTCTLTGSPHSEECYGQQTQVIHTGNNQHQHTSSCAYHMYYPAITVSNNFPISFTTSEVCKVSLRMNTSGTFTAWTTGLSDSADSYGHLYKNGTKVASDDDGNGNLNFKVSCSYSSGDLIEVYVNSYSNRTGSATLWYSYKSAGGANNTQTGSKGISWSTSEVCKLDLTMSSSGTFTAWTESISSGDPYGFLYRNGSPVASDDDGNGNLNFKVSCSYSAGDRITLNVRSYSDRTGSATLKWSYSGPSGTGTKVYDCGNKPLNIHVCNDHTYVSGANCFTSQIPVLSCSDPHHVQSYSKGVLSYGRRHYDGTICSGTGCPKCASNMRIQNLKGEWLYPNNLRYVVTHANGDYHLSASTTRCSMCGNLCEYVTNATSNNVRNDISPSEIQHGASCYKPCGNPANHDGRTTQVSTNTGLTISAGTFLNLDWGFRMYYPNTGNMYGTGRLGAGNVTNERGKGYTSNMDCTIFTKEKYVIFSFDVVYEGISYLAGTPISLCVPQVWFDFYLPLEQSEMAAAEVCYVSQAINDPSLSTVDCNPMETRNLRKCNRYSHKLAYEHDADKRFWIDVVGRIGQLTLNDTGDWRYSNLFKTATTGWVVENVVHTVNLASQNFTLTDQVDVRGYPIANTGNGGSTYGTRDNLRGQTKALPLTPEKNNIESLRKTPVRVGYDAYFDVTTLGNYYGGTAIDNGSMVPDWTNSGNNYVRITPHYYALKVTGGGTTFKEVDIYRKENDKYILINKAEGSAGVDNTINSQVSLDWVNENARRLYSATESALTDIVHQSLGLDQPRGTGWYYGNYDSLRLWARNRTSIGYKYTYAEPLGPTDKIDPYGMLTPKPVDADPSNAFSAIRFYLQGARWHFNVGLPSSAVFVYKNEVCNDANIKKVKDDTTVIAVALEIYAFGDVWTLVYDGKHMNSIAWHLVPGDSGFTFHPTYPSPDPSDPIGSTTTQPSRPEMPVVELISVDHTSQEDLGVVGTN